MKLCECGCGSEVLRRFVSGHNGRGRTNTVEHRRHISEALTRSWAGNHAGRDGTASRKGWAKRVRFPVGSKYTDGQDYVRVKVEEGKGRWIGEHILVMEMMVGMKLNKGEIVHHINGVRADNRPENLYLCRDRKHHNAVHRSQDAALRASLALGRITFTDGIYEAVL